MTRFLSPAWVERFNELTASHRVALPGPEAGLAAQSGAFTMAELVQGGPEGEICTLVRVDGGRVSMALVDPDAAGQADVAVRLSWDDAVALSQGRLAPYQALAGGRIRVRGDLSVLAAAHGALGELQPLVAQLQAETTY